MQNICSTYLSSSYLTHYEHLSCLAGIFCSCSVCVFYSKCSQFKKVLTFLYHTWLICTSNTALYSILEKDRICSFKHSVHWELPWRPLYINKDVSVAWSDFHPKQKTFLQDVTTELNAFHFDVYSDCCVKYFIRCKMFVAVKRDTGKRSITTFRSTMNTVCKDGPVRL